MAYDHYARGCNLFRTFSRAGAAAAKTAFADAIASDPNFARAYGWLGYVHHAEIQEGWSTDVKKSFDSALELGSRGVELAPDDYYTHWNLASIYVGHKNFEAGQKEFELALALNPNDADMLADIADMYSYQGKADKGVEYVERAMRLKIPEWYHWSLGFALFQQRRYEEAVAALERMSDPPNTAFILLAACRAKLSKPISPEEIMLQIRRKDPDWAPNHLSVFPFVNVEDQRHYLEALSEAGIPI